MQIQLMKTILIFQLLMLVALQKFANWRSLLLTLSKNVLTEA